MSDRIFRSTSNPVFRSAHTPSELPEAQPTEAEFVHDVDLSSSRVQGGSELADMICATSKPFDLQVRLDPSGTREFRLKGHDASLPAIEKLLEAIFRQSIREALIKLVIPLVILAGVAWAISPLLPLIYPQQRSERRAN